MARPPKPAHILDRLKHADEVVDVENINVKVKSDKRARIKRPNQKRKATVANNDVRGVINEQKWERILQYIGNGIKRSVIYDKLKITRQTFETYLITHVKAYKQVREAELVWIRRSWTTEELNLIFSHMCTGKTVKQSAIDIGWPPERLVSFYAIIRRDKYIKEQYDEVRKIQAESWLDDNIDIADNRGGDKYIDAKGIERVDHAVIQRDKTRIETRQWTMGVVHRDRFGDHKRVDLSGELVINHAMQLGQARKRLEESKKAPAESSKVVSEQ